MTEGLIKTECYVNGDLKPHPQIPCAPSWASIWQGHSRMPLQWNDLYNKGFCMSWLNSYFSYVFPTCILNAFKVITTTTNLPVQWRNSGIPDGWFVALQWMHVAVPPLPFVLINERWWAYEAAVDTTWEGAESAVDNRNSFPFLLPL